MSKTEEGALKEQIKRYLHQLGWKPNDVTSKLRVFMPVQQGMGGPALDFIVCYRGRYIEFETKKPGGKPTPRQHFVGDQVQSAQGISFYCDSFESFKLNAVMAGLVPEGHPQCGTFPTRKK